MKKSNFLVATAAVLCVGTVGAQAQTVGPGVPKFEVRPGYEVTLATQGIRGLRFMEFGADPATLYVSQPSGTISTLKRQPDGTFTKLANFIAGKPTVHGMEFTGGWLWYTQSNAIWKARDTNGDGKADEDVKIVDGLPSGGGHWWRTILVSDDGFYTSIGDSGNATDDPTTERQKVWKFSLDGQTKTLWSSGLRNTEKLMFRPGTKEVWGADHGSDNYGKALGEGAGNQPVTDHIPACEFNRYDQSGFYGHPYIVSTGEPRPEFATRPDILELANKTIAPKWSLGAHWAPNGWTFATKSAIGAPGDAYIACHGSWNSTKKVGYLVERIVFDDVTSLPMGAQTMVSMLTSDGNVLDRPVDVTEDPANGSLLISGDNGNIYRIARK